MHVANIYTTIWLFISAVLSPPPPDRGRHIVFVSIIICICCVLPCEHLNHFDFYLQTLIMYWSHQGLGRVWKLVTLTLIFKVKLTLKHPYFFKNLIVKNIIFNLNCLFIISVSNTIFENWWSWPSSLMSNWPSNFQKILTVKHLTVLNFTFQLELCIDHLKVLDFSKNLWIGLQT